MFTKAFSLLLLPALALAQYGPPPGPANPGPTSSAAPPPVPSAPANTPGQMNIDVAAGGKFVFGPSNITAPVGTLVTFFFPNAGITHSVTQSSFANPCTYLAASGNSSAGFDSGLQAGAQFTINITNTDPIWFFCKQVSHCGLGMVGSINAPASGNTFSAFQAAAMAIGSNEPTITDNGPVTGGVNGVASAAPSSDTGSSSSGGGGNTGGAVGLAASGAVALFSVAVVGLLM
ncbi:Cupredoxin [Panaeolus papilionaceus]|nr:Cupredoxin [Panaeolus papilionaceus]